MSQDDKFVLNAPEGDTPAEQGNGAGVTGAPGAPAGQPIGNEGDANTVHAPLIIDGGDDTFEQITKTSQKVPVILDFWAEWCGPCRQLGPALEAVVRELAGQVQLVKVNVDQNQMLAQGFQIQGIPAVFGLVGGQPVPLFQGAVGKEQIRAVVKQLIEAARKAGISGRIVDNGEKPKAEPTPEELAVAAAIEQGDFDEAERLLNKEIANNPADKELKAALAQVRLQRRLSEEGEAAVDDSDPLALADQFVKTGNTAAAYQVLLDAIGGCDDSERIEELRARLVELFSVDPDPQAVATARRQLSRLLF